MACALAAIRDAQHALPVLLPLAQHVGPRFAARLASNGPAAMALRRRVAGTPVEESLQDELEALLAANGQAARLSQAGVCSPI
jgi:hypothetical protein